MKYGIVLDGILMLTFDAPEEAYQAAQFAYEESGAFHEVRIVSKAAKGIAE